VLSPEVEMTIKRLEEKIEQTVSLINNLRQENLNLKAKLSDMQAYNNQSIEKINLILDNISKML
jgi:hypothetical protein